MVMSDEIMKKIFDDIMVTSDEIMFVFDAIMGLPVDIMGWVYDIMGFYIATITNVCKLFFVRCNYFHDMQNFAFYAHIKGSVNTKSLIITLKVEKEATSSDTMTNIAKKGQKN